MKARELAVVAVLFLSGALFAQDNEKSKGKHDEEFKNKTKEIEQEVVKMRGLEFKKEVDVGVYTVKELKEFLKKEIEDSLPADKSEGYTKGYIKLGVVPTDIDLKDAYLKLLTSQIGGFYDPRNKQLKLIDRFSPTEKTEAEDDEFSKQMKMADDMIKMTQGVSLDDIIMAHELTHAAQDQHYDLITLPIDNDFNDDLAIAIKCVVEGDASIIMYNYLLGDQYDAMTSIFAMLPDGGASLMGNMPMPKVPEFLMQQLVFPYTQGFSFTSKVKGKDDFSRVNKMFEDMPASTEQILHPEKYSKNRDYPQDIKLPDVTSVLGSDYKVHLSNVIGEFSLRLLLKEFKVSRVNAIASGWDGDRFAVLGKGGGTTTTDKKAIDPNKLVLLWFTTWDTEDDAAEFLDAYQRVIEKKYPDAKLQERDKSTAQYKYVNADDTISAVERKGNDVLILESISQDKFSGLRDLLWDETTKKEVKKVERIEPKPRKK